MNKNLNGNREISIYVSHICKQLLDTLISNADFEVLLKRHSQPHKKIKAKDVIRKDDMYIKIIAKLLTQNLDYYLENLDIVFDESTFELIDLRYDYYDKHENRFDENKLKTDIQVLYI